MLSSILISQSELLALFANILHGAARGSVLAVPAVTVEENQVHRRRPLLPLVDA
jgi:hypothetical protein